MEAARIASEDLCANITMALDLLGALTDIAIEKEAFLTSGDIEGLRGAIDKEEDILTALNRTEKDRKVYADALSQAIGLYSKDATLKDILEKITDSAMKVRLSGLRDALLAAAEQLSALNDKLGQLLKLQIGYTDYMINLLYIPKSRNNSYNIQGSRRDDSNNLSLMDLHV